MDGLAYHGSFAKQKMQERFGNIAAAKHSLLLLICIFPSSQREHFSSAEKQIPKAKAFCALDIFSRLTTNVQFLCSAERQINLELKKTDFLLCTPADPFVRSAALQWVDRQRDREPTYQPCHLPILKPTTFSLTTS